MGEVKVQIELGNYADEVLSEHGYLEASKIRKETTMVIADSGCTSLTLPQELVERLGLKVWPEKVIVTYADGRKEERHKAGAVRVRVNDRSMVTACVMGPPASEPLLGQIILEELDLLVDCKEGKLVPRPESPHLPTLKM